MFTLIYSINGVVFEKQDDERKLSQFAYLLSATTDLEWFKILSPVGDLVKSK